MSQRRFELACQDDDAQLRRLLANCPMPGRVSLAFRREPSFWQAAAVEGDNVQVIACRDTVTGAIVGLGCRSVRSRYVGGELRRVGYLSGLRVDPAHRGHTVIARGYRFLRELDADGQADYYLTTIAADNQAAVDLLTSGRAGLPGYHRVGTYHTLAIAAGRAQRRGGSLPRTRAATPADLPAILEFFHNKRAHCDFLPAYTAADFGPQAATFHGLPIERISLAEDDTGLLGTLALWDQRPFKQVVLQSYPWAWRLARAPYNLYAQVRGLPRLGLPGETLPCLSAALVAVTPHQTTRPEVFTALLQHAARQMAPGDYLLLGLSAGDPLLELARPLADQTYDTGVYLATWKPDRLPARNGWPLYLELGCL